MIEPNSGEINFRKLFFLTLLISSMYGSSPFIAHVFFDTESPYLLSYGTTFLFCFLLLAVAAFPSRYKLQFSLKLNKNIILALFLTATLLYVYSRILVFGGFEAAFLGSYNDRTGTSVLGLMRYVYAPTAVFFVAVIFVYSSVIFLERRTIGRVHLFFIFFGLALLFLTGSRNLLLFGLCGVIALVVSTLSYAKILATPFLIYFLAVFFVMIRNEGVAYFLTGGELPSYFRIEYLNPAIHEYNTTYSVFRILEDRGELAQLVNAPYGLYPSFFINQLPLALKPSDFISFTEYFSILYAPSGEGLGSSPVFEMHVSAFTVTPLVLISAMLVFWAHKLFSKSDLKFVCVALTIPFAFNFWRIGAAENIKMFLSYSLSVIFILIISRIKFKSYAENKQI